MAENDTSWSPEDNSEKRDEGDVHKYINNSTSGNDTGEKKDDRISPAHSISQKFCQGSTVINDIIAHGKTLNRDRDIICIR